MSGWGRAATSPAWPCCLQTSSWAKLNKPQVFLGQKAPLGQAWWGTWGLPETWMSPGAPWWGCSCTQPMAGQTHTPERLRSGRPGDQCTALGLIPWAWARRQPGAPRRSQHLSASSGEQESGEGIAEPQDMQLGLAVPKAKQSELLDPQGVQKPGFSPTPTPSIRPFPLAHAGSPNPHLQPIFPLTSAHLRLLSSCSSPAGKSAHISVAFQILIWSIQLRAAA